MEKEDSTERINLKNLTICKTANPLELHLFARREYKINEEENINRMRSSLSYSFEQ